MKRLLLLGLLACSSGPTVDGVEPSNVQTGGDLTIFGSGFSEQMNVALQHADGTQTPLENVQPSGAVLKGQVPTSLKTAEYQVVLRTAGDVVVTPLTVAVEAPVPDVPCGGDYTANTQVSWVRKVIVVDRFYKDGAREVVRTPFDEVEKIEVVAVPHEKGTCSVVYIRKADGSRVRYAESLTEDLSARAYKFANELKKPVDTKR